MKSGADSSLPKVLAISSGGGHWIQLMRLRTALEGSNLTFATVRAGYQEDVPGCQFKVLKDATRWNKFALLILFFQVLWLILRIRPDVVITTGAAPGYFAIRIGKVFGAKTCWIDSIANVDSLSLSGKMAGRHAKLWRTQWKELATQDGPSFHGSVITEIPSTHKEESHGHSPTAGSR